MEIVIDKTKEKKLCSICGNEGKYIEQYNRWYCWNCKIYIEEPKKIKNKPIVIYNNSLSFKIIFIISIIVLISILLNLYII